MNRSFVDNMFKVVSRVTQLGKWNASRCISCTQIVQMPVPPLQTPSRERESNEITLGKDNQNVYEIRTYAIRPKHFKEYIKITEENFNLRTKHSKLFGYFTSELGALNEVNHIWEYDSHEHRSSVRKALATDEEWQNNYVKLVSHMWMHQQNATMILLPWSMITLPSKPGVYELQIFHMNSHTDIWDGRLKAAMELSSIKLKESHSVLIGCFTTVFGQHNTVYALWQHETFDKYAFGKLQLYNDTNKSVLHAFYHEVLTGYSKALLPQKISPLK